jgi:hypothetical protein
MVRSNFAGRRNEKEDLDHRIRTGSYSKVLGGDPRRIGHLHKALLESEKLEYEKNVGPIRSPNHFFQLLTNDPYFAWLRPISQLIVAIDETLDEKGPLTNDSVDSLMKHSVFLLIPAQSTGDFAEHYVAALQRDPRVILAHAQVAKRIGSDNPVAEH